MLSRKTYLFSTSVVPSRQFSSIGLKINSEDIRLLAFGYTSVYYQVTKNMVLENSIVFQNQNNDMFIKMNRAKKN